MHRSSVASIWNTSPPVGYFLRRVSRRLQPRSGNRTQGGEKDHPNTHSTVCICVHILIFIMRDTPPFIVAFRPDPPSAPPSFPNPFAPPVPSGYPRPSAGYRNVVVVYSARGVPTVAARWHACLGEGVARWPRQDRNEMDGHGSHQIGADQMIQACGLETSASSVYWPSVTGTEWNVRKRQLGLQPAYPIHKTRPDTKETDMTNTTESNPAYIL